MRRVLPVVLVLSSLAMVLALPSGCFAASSSSAAATASPLKPRVTPSNPSMALPSTPAPQSTSQPSSQLAPHFGWGHAPANSAWHPPLVSPLPQPILPSSVTGPTVQEANTATAAADMLRKVVIDIPSRTLRVMDGNKVVKQFPVGVGRLGFMTPLGKHAVIRKIKNPGWENPYKAAGAVTIRPGANNPLGTRWIGFKADPKGEFGIHGTDSPQSVGKLSSHGCVRMLVPHAEQVFELVNVGTPVEVTYQTVQLSQTPAGEIRVTRYPDWFNRGMPSLATVRQQIATRFGPNATVNEAALQTALTQPAAEVPVVVGQLVTPVANTTPQTGSATSTP
jgi:lipoprotein-anchoring transpeptidase ErfK/SrfK